MTLLLLTEGVNVAVVVVKLLFCAGDALTGGTQIDVVLVVILLHCLSFPALGREEADTTKAGASDDTPASYTHEKA